MDEVETMFASRNRAWHGKGEFTTEPLSAKDALVLAGLDWEVELEPLYVRTGELYVTVDGHFATVRDTDQAVLGLVGSKYRVILNREAFDFLDSVAGQSLHYNSAGSLKSGRVVFLCAEIPSNIMIGGVDPVRLFLVMATSHDGSMATTVMVTPTRTECWNTLNIGLRNATGKWTIRHTEEALNKVAQARDALDLTFAYADAWETEMNQLINSAFTKAEFEGMVRDVFPGKSPGAFTPEQYALIGVLESSPTIADSFRYTKWGALNAVREYDDWGPRRGREGVDESELRTQDAWFGKNVDRSNKVFKFLSVPA